MKKKTVSGMLLTLLFTCMLTSAFNIRQVKASATIYIRPDGSVEGTDKIQRNGDVYTFIDNINDNIVVQRDNIIVDGNSYTLRGAGDGTGFDLSNINNVTIRKTRITEWKYGIHIYNMCSDNTIVENYLTANVQRAIFLSNSSDNTIRDNNIVNNVGEGILLWLTNATTVVGNDVSHNGEDGISISYSSFNNNIINNHVSNNSEAGVSLPFENSTGNTITGNDITQNAWAGIYISWTTASDNTFYHNNLDNTLQVFTVEATNIWDNGYPCGGNYWSDYTGPDSNGDGIGDTPYSIDADNQDNHPLMAPWTQLPGDIDGDGYVGSADAGILNGAYGTTLGDPNYHARADFDLDGYIGSADAGILNGNYGTSI